jgi:hypothetical protein
MFFELNKVLSMVVVLLVYMELKERFRWSIRRRSSVDSVVEVAWIPSKRGNLHIPGGHNGVADHLRLAIQRSAGGLHAQLESCPGGKERGGQGV